ncbi:MAG: YcnI family copper-binding membrane protein [Gammaproteobacteria bacterium]|jgi:uncharacterized protein YcnI
MNFCNNNTRLKITKIWITLLLFGLSATVFSHASLEQDVAVSGENYRGVLRITHGCNGSPTIAVRIRIPDGVTGTKPMPKAGWQLETVEMKLDEPYISYGTTVTENVRELTWKGGLLSDNFFDEFVFRATLPDTDENMTLYFRTIQECENGEFLRWIEIPGSGEDVDDFSEPAPTLKLLPVDKNI